MAGGIFSQKFDAHFQRCFVAFVLKDADFLERVARDLKPEYFTDDAMQRIVRACIAHFHERGTSPKTLIYREFNDLRYSGLLSEDLHKRIVLILEDLIEIQLENRDYIFDEFEKFVRYQRIESSMPKVSELASAGRFEEAEALLATLSEPIGMQIILGQPYTSDVQERIQRRGREDEERCWTLIDPIDKYITGLRGGETMVFQSQKSSMGKTALMVQLAKNFMFSGKKVLFFSLEESIAALEDRLDQCISGVLNDGEGLLEAEFIHRRVERYTSRNGGIWLAKMPDASTRVSDLKRAAKMIRAQKNFAYNVVIIDYADLLLPEVASMQGDLYQTGKNVYSNWREWMQDENIPGYTGMQSNRAASDNEFADQQHSGGSISKPQYADVVVSLNQSKDKEKQGRLTLFIVKNRNGQKHISIPVTPDFARQRIWSYEQSLD